MAGYGEGCDATRTREEVVRRCGGEGGAAARGDKVVRRRGGEGGEAARGREGGAAVWEGGGGPAARWVGVGGVAARGEGDLVRRRGVKT